MKLSIIIPVYNEERSIDAVIQKVLSVPIEKEILIVDDGSTDRTPDIIEAHRRSNAATIRLHNHRSNAGKGTAIRTALPHVTGEITLIQDADLELDPNEYQALIDPILNGKSDVVYGSRFLGPHHNQNIPFRSRLARFVLTTLANRLYRLSLTDEATAYKVFKTDLLRKMSLKARRFEFCPEVTAKLSKMGCSILEVPIGYQPRSEGEGKKIRYLRDGWSAVWTLIRLRFKD